MQVIKDKLDEPKISCKQKLENKNNIFSTHRRNITI